MIDQKLKDRLLITEGELVAGNDNPEVIKELIFFNEIISFRNDKFC